MTMPMPPKPGVPTVNKVDPIGDLGVLLHNTLVLYGPTGTRKTVSIGDFAKYIYEKTGKKTRLLTADGGGWGPAQDVVNAGILEPWRVVEEDKPLLAVMKASKGYWPKKLNNGIREGLIQTSSIADVGAYAVEGWASIAALVMGYLVEKGQKINEEVVGKFVEQDQELGNESFGAPGRSHYGFVQNFVLSIIRNFSGLPVERVLYTTIEGKGEDKISKSLQYGPAVAGGALVASIPTYVGDCLHFEDFVEEVGTEGKQKLVEAKVRIWFTQHPDVQTGVMWPAKPRIVADKYEEFKKRMGDKGYFVWAKGGPNLGTYLRTQDELLAEASDAAKEWKRQIDAKRELEAKALMG